MDGVNPVFIKMQVSTSISVKKCPFGQLEAKTEYSQIVPLRKDTNTNANPDVKKR